MAGVQNPPAARLRRSPTARLFGPDYFQWLPWAYIGLAVLTVIIAPSLGPYASAPAVAVLVVAVAFVAWSATGGATADDTGLRWRLRVPAHTPWTDVAKIEFAALAHGRFYFGASTRLTPATLVIRIHERVDPARAKIVTSAVSPGRGNLSGFAGAVLTQARAHGVPVEVSDVRWNRVLGTVAPESLDGGAGLTRAAQHTGPPPRRRGALAGLVLIIIGLLALAGAVSGWDAHGTGGRIILGIVAAVFLVNGMLLVRPARPRVTSAHASAEALVLTRRRGGTITIPWHELTSVRLRPLGRGAAPRAYLLDLSGDETLGRRHPGLGRTARPPGGGPSRTIIPLDGATGSALADQLPRFAGQRYVS